MNPRIIGLTLVLIGIAVIGLAGYAFATTHEVIHLGGLLTINVANEQTVQYLPVFGIVLMIGGIMKIFPQ